jgi:hypothetical protein
MFQDWPNAGRPETARFDATDIEARIEAAARDNLYCG